MKHILLSISAAALALTVGAAAAAAEPEAPSEAQAKEISASLLEAGGTVFPIGVENVGYAKYFTGQTFLASLTPAGQSLGVSNVTFAPGSSISGIRIRSPARCWWASPAAAGTRSGARSRRKSFPERPRRFRKTSSTGTARSMAVGSSIFPSCRRVRERPGWSRWIPLNTRSSSDLRNAKKVKKRPEASSGIRPGVERFWMGERKRGRSESARFLRTCGDYFCALMYSAAESTAMRAELTAKPTVEPAIRRS